MQLELCSCSCSSLRVSGGGTIISSAQQNDPSACRGPGIRTLHRDSYSAAVRHRKAKHAERTLVLDNLVVLDVELCVLSEATQLVIRDGRIAEVNTAGSVRPKEEANVLVDCRGLVCMPGLCDAHVHCTAASANLASLLSLPESLVTAHATHILEGMISRGFTTVRDAGGADFGLAKAVDDGLILGPRVLFTGHALSQTGGHGDMRGAGEDVCACGAALRGIGRVCDGDAEVRRAARDELRKGAHCIKIMASGGVASPTDRLTNNQFSVGEIRAIVEEAEAAGTYVCAHAYMPSAIDRAIKAGVRSIEHGNWLDNKTAQLMASKAAFLVPTLITYAALSESGKEAGMPEELVAKVGNAVEQGLKSLQVAQDAGVIQCYGSDLLGALHNRQLDEFKLRSRVLSPADLIEAATRNCELLFNLQGCVGQVKPGYRADLLLIAGGTPNEDLSLLYDTPVAAGTAQQQQHAPSAPPAGSLLAQLQAAVGASGAVRRDARGVVAVFKDGLLARGCVRGVQDKAQCSLNEALFAT